MRSAGTAVARWHAGRLVVVLAAGAALTGLALVVGVPLLLATIVLGAGAALVAIKPVVGLSVALFLLYSNIPVVAATRGTVPFAVAVVVPGLIALAAMHQVVIRRQPLVLDRTFGLMLAFLAVLLVGALRAEGQGVALQRIGIYVSEGLIIYLLVRNAVRDRSALRVAMWSAIAAAALLSALALYQAVTGSYEQDFYGLAPRNLEFVDPEGPTPAATEMAVADRATGPMGEPNRFAQVLLMTVPLALVLYRNPWRRGGAAWALAGGLLALAGVVLTYSRGAFLTLVVLTALTVPLRLMSGRRLAVGLVLLLLAVPVVAPAYVGRIASIGAVGELLGGSPEAPDAVTRGRTTEMLAALAVYLDHPVVGVGPGQYVAYYSVEYQSLPEVGLREIATPRRAHDLYLEVAAETGTIGLLIFMAIPLLLLLDLYALHVSMREARPRDARLASAFILVVLAYLGTGVFLHLAYERYYWLVVALTASAVGILKSSDEPTPPLAWRRPIGSL